MQLIKTKTSFLALNIIFKLFFQAFMKNLNEETVEIYLFIDLKLILEFMKNFNIEVLFKMLINLL